MVPTPGAMLGPYRIEAPIGAGGMGAVWKARDTRLDRTVAIKFIEGRFSERFEREAKTIASLNHPNICTLHDVGENYLVMEYIDGSPIQGPLPVAEVVRLGAQIAEALDAAHRKGITHRDLKPGNVLVTKSGVKVIDFGLAKAGPAVSLGANDATLTKPLTAEGTILGTVPYMSPEQLHGDEADARSDIFALGCVLYEVLTGKRAFDGQSQVSIMAAILEHEPAPLTEPATPAWLDRIIRRCLRKNPDDRWQNARDVAIELHDPPPAVNAKPEPKRSWWPLALAAAVAIAGFALIAAILPRGEISGRGLELSPVASSVGSKHAPVFSPDGKSVAYFRRVGGRWQLAVQTLGANAETVLAEALHVSVANLQWTPDGTHILYTGTGGLWRVSVAGGDPERLLRRVPGPVTWLPSRKGLLALQRGPRAEAAFSVSDPVGSEFHPLADFEPVKGLPVGMRFSPNGRKLAITTGDGVWIAEWPRGSRRFIKVSSARTPAWFPDNRHLLIASFGLRQLIVFDSESDAFNVIRTGEDRIREATLSSDGSRVIYNTGPSPVHAYEYTVQSPGNPTVLVREASSGNWIPDGRTFVFRRHLGGGRVYLLARDEPAGQVRRIAEVEESEGAPVTPSPDGKRIAFLAKGKLWTVAATGGPPVPISDCDGGAMAWSPDGAWLAFRVSGWLAKASSQGGGVPTKIVEAGITGSSPGFAWTRAGIYFRKDNKLMRIAPEGGSVVTLSELPEDGNIEHASPDGRVIYVRRLAPGGAELVEFDAMSGAITKVTPIASDGEVRRFSVHPDGRRIAVEIADSNFDLWMIKGFPAPAVGWERLFWRWLERPAAP